MNEPICPYCDSARIQGSDTPDFLQCSQCRAWLPRGGIPTPRIQEPDLLPNVEVGTILRGRYRLEALLGSGCQGVTYLAEHLFVNHSCVVKLLPSRVGDARDESVRRLRAEASAGFRVNHANVVRVLDGDVVDGVWFFVMEYVDGASLASLIDAGLRVPWQQVAQIAGAAAAGLAAIHRAGLLHRDVKPSNILLGADGRCQIADLGVSTTSGPGFGATGHSAARAGSLAYAAPELFIGESRPHEQADLFSLGVSLFHLATGRLPFPSASPLRLLIDLQNRVAAWPAELQRDYPEWLTNLILTLLSGDPAERPRSAREVAEFVARESSQRREVPLDAGPERVTPHGVVVPVFRNLSGEESDDWLGQALADHLGRSLWQQSGLYVVDREDFARVKERVRREDESAELNQLEAGRLLGAATIISGAYQREREWVRIELSCRSLRDGRSETFEVEGSLTMLVDLQARLHELAARSLGVSGVAEERAGQSAAPSANAQERFIAAKKCYLRGDYESAISAAKAALETDPDFAEAVGLIGLCDSKMGRYAAAVESHQRQEAIGQRLNDSRAMVEARANLGAMHYFRGEYDAAYDAYSAATRIAERHGLSVELAKIANNLGFVLFQLGRTAEAKSAYSRAIETHRANGAIVSLVGPYNGMGNVLREEGRLDEAIAYHQRALALAQESDDRVNVGICYVYLGRCAAHQNRLADAKRDLAAALNILEETSFWNGLARVYESMAELNLRLGDWAEAARCADKRIDLARQHANHRMEAAAWRQKAAALELGRQPGAAASCIERAGRLETPAAREAVGAGRNQGAA